MAHQDSDHLWGFGLRRTSATSRFWNRTKVSDSSVAYHCRSDLRIESVQSGILGLIHADGANSKWTSPKTTELAPMHHPIFVAFSHGFLLSFLNRIRIGAPRTESLPFWENQSPCFSIPWLPARGTFRESKVGVNSEFNNSFNQNGFRKFMVISIDRRVVSSQKRSKQPHVSVQSRCCWRMGPFHNRVDSKTRMADRKANQIQNRFK